MIPQTPGKHQWTDTQGWWGARGEKYLLDIVDVGNPQEPWLRVYFEGGYYNIQPDDFSDEEYCWPQEGWI